MPLPLPLVAAALLAPAALPSQDPIDLLNEPARVPRAIDPRPGESDLIAYRAQPDRTPAPLGVVLARAEAASLCRDAEGRLVTAFQWFPQDRPAAYDRIAVAFSEDEGESWGEPLPIVIEGLPEDHVRATDPCLVKLEDGRLRMYFTTHRRYSGEAGTRAPDAWPATWSAVSEGGLAWRVEPGVRVGIPGTQIADPAVVRFRGEWHYFAAVEGRDGTAFHAISADGLEFVRRPEIEVEGAGAWRGAVIVEEEDGEPDGFLRFFGTGRIGWGAMSRDGSRWRLEPRVHWSPGSDPAVARLADGSLLLLATAPGAAADEADAALGAALGGAPTAALAANDRFVYVLRGDTLYMFEATTLRFLRMKRLPSEGLGEPAPSVR